jgi:hypothetical protein
MTEVIDNLNVADRIVQYSKDLNDLHFCMTPLSVLFRKPVTIFIRLFEWFKC